MVEKVILKGEDFKRNIEIFLENKTLMTRMFPKEDDLICYWTNNLVSMGHVSKNNHYYSYVPSVKIKTKKELDNIPDISVSRFHDRFNMFAEFEFADVLDAFYFKLRFC